MRLLSVFAIIAVVGCGAFSLEEDPHLERWKMMKMAEDLAPAIQSAVAVLTKNDLLHAIGEGMSHVASETNSLHADFVQRLRNHHKKFSVMAQSAQLQANFSTCDGAFQRFFSFGDTYQCFRQFNWLFGNLSDTSITEQQRDNQVHDFCDKSVTTSCINVVANGLRDIAQNCDGTILDNDQFKQDLKNLFKLSELPCIPNTTPGEAIRYCFPKFALLVTFQGFDQNTITEQKLNTVCHVCVTKFFWSFLSFDDSPNQGSASKGALFHARILCLKDQGVFCTLWIQQNLVASSTGDINSMLNAFCSNNCLNMLFNSLLDWSVEFNGTISSNDRTMFTKFSQGICRVDPSDGQNCLNKVFNAYTNNAQSQSCNNDAGSGTCSDACKPVVQNVAAQSGCCMYILFDLLGSSTNNSLQNWMVNQCGATVAPPCLETTSFVTTRLPFPDVKFDTINGNSTLKDAFILGCRKDTASACFTRVEKVSCVISRFVASKTREIGLEAATDGIEATATITAGSAMEAKSIGSSINTAISLGAFPTENTNTAVPPSAKTDPLVPCAVATSQATVDVTSVALVRSPALHSLVILCAAMLVVVTRME